MSMDISQNTLELVLLGVCGAHLVGAAALSRVARGPREAALVADGDRDVYKLAALHGGAVCVATAALARLQAAGCLDVSGGSIATAWRLEGEVCPVERELYEAIERDRGASVVSITATLTRGLAYAPVVASLREAGLLPPARVAASLRGLNGLAWLYAPVVLLVLAGDGEHALPWEMLGLALLTPIVVTSMIRRAEQATRSGMAVLERHRDRVRHLDDGLVADRDLALAVALFGSEPLRRTYPDLAMAWDNPCARKRPRWRQCWADIGAKVSPGDIFAPLASLLARREGFTRRSSQRVGWRSWPRRAHSRRPRSASGATRRD